MQIKPANDLAIGIFDSGIGGLTVVQSVRKRLPGENIYYFGDTARVPYGIKSDDTIRAYSEEITRFLVEKNIKLLLIACNSVSAVARETVIRAAGDIPVLDVITAGKCAAIESRTRKIGVTGTLATISSEAYVRALKAGNSDIEIKSKACPMLVPLAEEGWTDNRIAVDILKLYLDDFLHNGVEALILGCTHYPLFKTSIIQIFREHNREILLIDSGESIADMAFKLLDENQLLNPNQQGTLTCYISDRPQRFEELAERFLGKRPESVEFVRPVEMR